MQQKQVLNFKVIFFFLQALDLSDALTLRFIVTQKSPFQFYYSSRNLLRQITRNNEQLKKQYLIAILTSST